jgi:hypothetical protein
MITAGCIFVLPAVVMSASFALAPSRLGATFMLTKFIPSKPASQTNVLYDADASQAKPGATTNRLAQAWLAKPIGGFATMAIEDARISDTDRLVD